MQTIKLLQVFLQVDIDPLQKQSIVVLVVTKVAPRWICRGQYHYIQCGGSSICILHKLEHSNSIIVCVHVGYCWNAQFM